MTVRILQQVIQSVPTSDGAGVKLRRSLAVSAACTSIRFWCSQASRFRSRSSSTARLQMNTREEVEQAVRDYQRGVLTE